MFTVGLVLLALVASSCGESGMSFDELDLALDKSQNEMKKIVSAEVYYTVWPENDSEIFVLPEDDETAFTDQHIIKEQGNSAVWRVFLVVAILLLAVVGVLSTVYYLCVWRGGRIQYELQKDTTP